MKTTNTVSNVSAGKPNVAGAVFRAPLGDLLTIPTDAHSSLAADFKALGYVSDGGVTNTNSPSVEKIKAWGGDVVLTTQTEKPDEWKFKLIEGMNTDVLEAVYGSANVTGDLTTGIEISANSEEPEEGVWVIDMILRGGALKRIVLPDAKVSEVGDIEYVDDDVFGYDLTLDALPDESGNTHYEYIEAADESE